MASMRKQDRFEKVAAARTEKINDMLRLLGNCANKTNYSYSDSEAAELFNSIEKNLYEAKQKYKTFQREKADSTFRISFDKNFTLIEGFMRNVRRFPDKKALLCPDTGKAYSFSELNCEINKCANAMLETGVKHGDKVMYQMGNCPEFVFIYAACQKIGATGCPVNMHISPAQTASIINFTKPVVFFYKYNGDSELAINMAVHKPRLVVVNFPKNRRILRGHITYEKLTDGDGDHEPKTEYTSDIYDETTLFYTSGTSGNQKCVPVTGINEVLSTYELMQLLSVNSEDVIINLSRWAHRGGLHCCGPSTMLFTGAALIASDGLSMPKCLDYIEKYKITLISGSPSLFRALVSEQKKAEKNLAAIKRIISVGSILSPEDSIRLRQFVSPNVYNGYGTTETFINTILTPTNHLFFSGTVGTPCISDEVRIVKIYDERNAEPDELIPCDGKTKGEIIIKSCSKSAGYYKSNSEHGGSRYYKEYLYTGDIGTWNSDRIITVTGRRDDMIVCDGEKIYPDEIESFLCRHPRINDCIVTSISDENGEDMIVAYIIKENGALKAEEIDQYCLDSKELADNIRPRFYRFKKILPKTNNGKKQHNKAKQMAVNDMKKGLLLRI